MAAANGDVKTTSNHVQVLSDIEDNSTMRVTSNQIQVLVTIPEDVPLRVTSNHVQVLVDLIQREDVEEVVGTSDSYVEQPIFFEGVEFKVQSSLEEITVYHDIDIGFNLSLNFDHQIVNWVRSDQPFVDDGDDWTPETPIL